MTNKKTPTPRRSILHRLLVNKEEPTVIDIEHTVTDEQAAALIGASPYVIGFDSARVDPRKVALIAEQSFGDSKTFEQLVAQSGGTLRVLGTRVVGDRVEATIAVDDEQLAEKIRSGVVRELKPHADLIIVDDPYDPDADLLDTDYASKARELLARRGLSFTGVKKYTHVSVGDARVRPEHQWIDRSVDLIIVDEPCRPGEDDADSFTTYAHEGPARLRMRCPLLPTPAEKASSAKLTTAVRVSDAQIELRRRGLSPGLLSQIQRAALAAPLRSGATVEMTADGLSPGLDVGAEQALLLALEGGA